MPIALESNQIEGPGLRRGMFCGSVCNSATAAAKKNVVDEREDQLDTSSSSSIGRNSDSSDGEGDSGEVEVQSPCKGPLDCLDALEEVLPMKYVNHFQLLPLFRVSKFCYLIPQF